jgi:hypothetical protein
MRRGPRIQDGWLGGVGGGGGGEKETQMQQTEQTYNRSPAPINSIHPYPYKPL